MGMVAQTFMTFANNFCTEISGQYLTMLWLLKYNLVAHLNSTKCTHLHPQYDQTLADFAVQGGGQ